MITIHVTINNTNFYLNQRTNSPDNAKLISGPCISTKHTDLDKNSRANHLLIQSVYYPNQFLGHRMRNFSKEYIIVTFCHKKLYVAKFDLAIKYVKVKPVSHFEQNIKG